MKKKIHAILTKDMKPKTLLLFTLAAVFAALLPIAMIAIYDHPCADDFTYGYYTHTFWNYTHSLPVTLKWAFHTIKSTYDTWQGTFSSAFLMSLSPGIFNEDYYWLSAFLMMGMIISSAFYLLKVVLVDLLKADRIAWGIISLVTVFLMFEQMHWPAQGIYWYNASIHYTFMNSCMLFLLGNGIRMLLLPSKRRIAANLISASIFALICSGSNYVTALIGLMLWSALFLTGLYLKKIKGLLLFLPEVIYAVGFVYNVIAPGNSIRQANFTKETPTLAIRDSLINGIRRCHEWTTPFLILILIVLIPVIWNMVMDMAKNNRFSFPLPAAVTFLSYGLISAMFTPNYYSQGTEGVARVINIVKILFHLLVILNEIYWLGWIAVKLYKKKVDILIPHYYYFYGTVAVTMLLVFQTSTNRDGEYITYGAYASLVTGQAEAYDQEYQNRISILESDEKNITLPAFVNRPFLLYVDDVTTDADDWRNNAMEVWYLKESIVLEDTAQ